MQNILIVEDNREQLDMLISTISTEYPSWTICSAQSYNEAVKALKNSLCGDLFTLFLLDIQLTEHPTDRGGFLFAEEIRKIPAYFKTNILFLTGISDAGGFALSNFHCYNYITKPYAPSDILNQLEQMLITGYLEKSFTIMDTDNIIHKLKSADIIYIQSIRHLKILHLKNSYISTRAYTLEQLIGLTDNDLIMCQKGYLINPAYITSIDRVTNSIVVGQSSIPMGKKYIEKLCQYITPLDKRKDIY